jgi:hypothetical protein
LGRWRRRPAMVVIQVVSRQPPMMPCRGIQCTSCTAAHAIQHASNS